MEDSKKKTIMQAIICAVLLCLIWGGYFVARDVINKKIETQADDFSWVYQIDRVYTKNNEFVLEGFAFEVGKDADEKAYEIVLQNTETKEFFFPKMQWIRREDVNKYFSDEYDYTKSGFVASIALDKLPLTQSDYEVLVRLGESRKAYYTDTYISKGELFYTKGGEHLLLDVKDTELEQVVNEGVLRLNLPNMGFYMYQHDGSLYCIMEEKYKEQEEYLNRIVMRYYSNQKKDITGVPGSGKGIEEDADVYFDDTTKFGQYYVTKSVLPTAYPIIKMNTGNYNHGHWVWQETFRPYYEFE